jgi:hypothetical protein
MSRVGSVGCRLTRKNKRKASPQIMEPCSPNPSGFSISPMWVPPSPRTASLNSCSTFSLLFPRHIFFLSPLEPIRIFFVTGKTAKREPQSDLLLFYPNKIQVQSKRKTRGGVNLFNQVKSVDATPVYAPAGISCAGNWPGSIDGGRTWCGMGGANRLMNYVPRIPGLGSPEISPK